VDKSNGVAGRSLSRGMKDQEKILPLQEEERPAAFLRVNQILAGR